MEGLTPEDEADLRETVSAIGEEQICATLEEMAKRELALLSHPRIAEDPELRLATIWNAGAIIAAAERLGAVPTRDSPDRLSQAKE